jgi:HEAT repeat protein
MPKIRTTVLLLAVGWSPLQSHASRASSEDIALMGLANSLRQDAPSAEQAAKALARMGPAAAPDAPQLVEALAYDEDSVYHAVSDALVSIGTPSCKPLERALDSANFIVRRRAVEILARFGKQAKRSVPGLVQRLKDPQYEVRSAAEKALDQLGEDAVPALANAARARSEEDARIIYLDALSRCGPKAIPTILEVLKKDSNPFVRARAASAAVVVRPVSPEVVGALIEELRDLEEGVRNAAADALGDSGDAAQAAIGALRIVADSDVEALTRQKASDALARIGTPATGSSAGQK